MEKDVVSSNAMLDALEVSIGPSPIVKVRTGAGPGIENADSGTVLVSITAPVNWMEPAADAHKAKNGVWSGIAIAAGDAGHLRVYEPDGTTQRLEYSVSAVGGSGEIVLLVNGVPGNTIAIGDLVSIENYFWDL